MTELSPCTSLDGFFVGMLDEEERAAIERLIEVGMAAIVYEGAAGFLGLGKVRIFPAPKPRIIP